MHLEEDFGEGGLEVAPLACVWRSVCGMLYADDAGNVSQSTEDLAKMTVIVTVFESAGLTVPETKTETTLLRKLNKVLPAPPLVGEAAGQMCNMQTMHFVYQGAVLSAQAPTLCQKNKRRIRLAWACYNRFKRELYDMKHASFTIYVRLPRTEMMDTLLYRRVARNLGQRHFADLRTAH